MNQDHVYQVTLGKNCRLSLPANLCRELGIKPGEPLLLTESEGEVKITSLYSLARKMRQEVSVKLGKNAVSLTADLERLRKQEAQREADSR